MLLPILGVAFVALATWAVMALWNGVLIKVVPAILAVTYWQALGILVLSKILLGGFGGGGRRGGGWKHGKPRGMAWRQKWREMSEEEREKIRQEWKNRCG